MSASRMKLTFLLWIPTQSASSASCVLRPGRNPYEMPRNSSSWIAFSSATTARWTILSSRAAAGGRGLPPIRLGDVHPPAWPRPIRSTLDPVVQIFEIALELCLVVLPHQPVHSRCRVPLELVERLREEIDADVVEERNELLLLPFPCDFPYAVQRAWHAGLALCPGHGLLVRISLGLRPWLPRLRCECLRRGLLRSRVHRFVRRLHSYYDGVRLLVPVHHRLRLRALPIARTPPAPC